MVHEICSVDRKKKKKKKERKKERKKNARETGHIRLQRMCKKKLDLETDLDTVASVTSNDPRLTFDPIK